MACLCAVESLSSCRKQNAGLFIEKYQRKIKEDDKKDDRPIQGMINTIIRILNYVATFLQLVLQHLSQCDTHIETSTRSF